MDWTPILVVLESAWLLAMGAWILLERRTPAATMAWILGLAFLPVLGIPVYLVFGPRRFRRKTFRYRKGRGSFPWLKSFATGPWPLPGGERFQRLASLACRLGESPPLPAPGLRWFTSGDACYEALFEALRAARHHIHLEYYILQDDRVGQELSDILRERAAAGVEVRLLADGIGSSSLGREFRRRLEDAGVQFAWFNPITFARLRPQLFNFRTHRKIAIIDGTTAFTGGINLCAEHSAISSGAAAWRDTHLCFEGDAVRWLQLRFLEQWHFAAGQVPEPEAYFPTRDSTAAGPFLQVISSGPDREEKAIYQFWVAALHAAERRILLTTPYFVPDEPILQALHSAVLRGVEVHLLVPKKGDSWLVTAAARSHYAGLVQKGVRVHEYGPPMLHAKTMVIDDDLVMVGSANLDNRSFRLNFEIMVALYDHEQARQARAQFTTDLTHAQPYGRLDVRDTPWPTRLLESAARLFSPML